MSIAEKFLTMEYGPALEDHKESQHWLDRHGRRFAHFINGAWQGPAAGEYFYTRGPCTAGKQVCALHGLSTGETSRGREDRVHRFHRSWPRDPRRHSQQPQTPFTRARRKIPLH